MDAPHQPQVCTGVRVTALEPAGGSGWTIHTQGQRPQGAQGEEGREQAQQAHAVVLATGGFAASQELLQRYAPQAAQLGTTNGAFATGEGLELGTQAGRWLSWWGPHRFT